MYGMPFIELTYCMEIQLISSGHYW